jgi:molybdopterin-guanine dinucleotide biosynthesis protein B
MEEKELSIPYVCIVGSSGSGKTTLIEKLLKHFASVGIAAATIKHAHGGYQLDKPGSDSWRHSIAGAVGVLLVGPDSCAAIWPNHELSELDAVERARRLFPDARLLLVEGYAGLPGPKVLVDRSGIDPKMPSDKASVLCVVSDRECGIGPRFDPSDVEGIARYLIAKLALRPR